MSDLWTTASADAVAERLSQHLTTARVAATAVWPFLAAARDEQDYVNRKALASERIERIAEAASDGDPALFTAVHAGLLDGLDEDFTVLHSDRLATLALRVEQSREQQAREAQVRDRFTEATLRNVLTAQKKMAGNLEDLPEAMQEKAKESGDGGDSESKDGESDSENSDEMPEFIQDKIEESKKESSKTASTYCPNHGVYVGEGNQEQHDHCKTEQRESKEESLKTAAGRATCNSCGNDFGMPGTGGMDRCPKCNSSDLKRTAGENPFANQTTPKPADADDAGTVDPKGTWTCPNCSATDAYTQGGKDLQAALDAAEPIQCGNCQQVDTSGGQQAQQQPQQGQSAPGQAPVQAVKTAMSYEAEEAYDEGFEDGALGTAPAVHYASDSEASAAYQRGYTEGRGLSSRGLDIAACRRAVAIRKDLRRNDKSLTPRQASRLAVTAAGMYDTDENPYVPQGVPDDMADGPSALPVPGAQPVTTRPRVLPDGGTTVTQGFASLSTLAANEFNDAAKKAPTCSVCGGKANHLAPGQNVHLSEPADGHAFKKG